MKPGLKPGELTVSAGSLYGAGGWEKMSGREEWVKMSKAFRVRLPNFWIGFHLNS